MMLCQLNFTVKRTAEDGYLYDAKPSRKVFLKRQRVDLVTECLRSQNATEIHAESIQIEEYMIQEVIQPEELSKTQEKETITNPESGDATSILHSKKMALKEASDDAPSSPDSQNLDSSMEPLIVTRLRKQRTRLLAALKLEKMKVKRFREQNRRKDRKIAALHNIIFDMKKKMLNDSGDVKIEEVILDNTY